MIVFLGMGMALAALVPLHVELKSTDPFKDKVYEPTIRVLLKKSSRIELVGQDLVAGVQAGLKKVALPGAIKIVCEKWTRQTKPQVQCRDTAGDFRLSSSTWIEFDSPSKLTKLDQKLYRGSLKFYPNGEVINELPIEQYLKGIVNEEISSRWPKESIVAQVISARSYALYRMDQQRKKHDALYDVEASTTDQKFGGFESEDFKSAQFVESSRGLVVMGKNTQVPLPAFYHASCGGRTELPEKVWGKHIKGFTQTVQCSTCQMASLWKRYFSKKALAEKILPILTAQMPSSQSIEIIDLKKQSSNQMRSDRVEVYFKKRGSPAIFRAKLGGPQFRNAMGVTLLKSTWFEIVSNGEGFSFIGRGYGHGVGLCQWGAKSMASKGKSAQEILSHYYPESHIKKFW